ncbi:MAG: ATP-dependent Clp protease proteolytic subunit [Nocardioides sp.]|uniref:ClpP family protease n=1 Tax=Nocardioides sp. TaxID=35761 RepID=UPI0039E3693F
MTETNFLAEDLDNRLLKERIVFLSGEVRDENTMKVHKQLLLLSAADPKADIYLHIHSPGGSVDAGFMVYDTMNYIPNDVVTISVGMAASMGQFLLCAGAPGKRFALPHSRIMMHQTSSGIGGSASDIKIQAEESKKLKKTLLEIIAQRSGKSYDQVVEDAERDRWFSAEEAKEYGLVDHVVTRVAQAQTGELTEGN